MSYDQASHLAQTWGLGLLALLFGAAVVYALWPGNKDKFKRAARAPLESEDDQDGQ